MRAGDGWRKKGKNNPGGHNYNICRDLICVKLLYNIE